MRISREGRAEQAAIFAMLQLIPIDEQGRATGYAGDVSGLIADCAGPAGGRVHTRRGADTAWS